jgi:hypothetical protein
MSAKKSGILAGLLLFLGLPCLSFSQTAWWKFDEIDKEGILEAVSKSYDSVTGYVQLVEGVRSKALKLDGFTASLVRPAERAPRLEGPFTLEAWVALGAYPWNWAPILAQENTISLNSNLDAVCWPDDIVVNSPRQGYFFGIGPGGHLGLHLGTGGTWLVCQSDTPVPLRKWSHVAAVYEPGQGIVLYMDGREAGHLEVSGRFRPAQEADLRIGMGRQKLEPTHPVRAFATLACWFSLDGILDEIKIHGSAVAAQAIASAAAFRLESEPDLPVRIMPSGPPGQGTFGASYMKLKYYWGWDVQWPVGSDPDVLVQFDDTPVRVVFWRGTRYGPAWVMENGLWMGDQSIENFNNQDGCIEHMLDPRCRFSHVRIVENNPARVVVHWRYCPTSANGNHSQVQSLSGWEDWVDEYYTFYPDAIGIRKVFQYSQGRSLWPEEVIGLCHPGQRPEDVVEMDAMTLVNLGGKSHTYSWSETTPRVREGDDYFHFGSAPNERPVIMVVNMKSRIRPFQIFEKTNRFSIFAHEHRRGISHFPWWNHWPVAQIPSDGRYCQAADRASHFSLAWGGPPPHDSGEGWYWWAWMYGASRENPTQLVPLAKSWLDAPTLSVEEGCASSDGYDLTQRCYQLTIPEQGADSVRIRLSGNPDSPVQNPAFVFRNWGTEEPVLSINGRTIDSGPDARFGFVRRVNQYDMVVWLRISSDAPVTLELKKQN